MSPDSPLGLLAQRVARIEQRVDDLATRAVERISDLAEGMKSLRAEATEDLKVFGPMLRDHAELRSDLKHLTGDVEKLRGVIAEAIHEFRQGLDELERREQARELDRQKIREDREAKEKTNRTLIKVAAFGLAGTFMTSLGAVLANVLGGGS